MNKNMGAKKKEIKSNCMKIRSISPYNFNVNGSVIPMVEIKIDTEYRYNNGKRYGYSDPVKINISESKLERSLANCHLEKDYDDLIGRELLEVKRNLQGKITEIVIG